MSDAMKNKARLALSGGRDIDRIVLYPDSSALWDLKVEEKLAALWPPLEQEANYPPPPELLDSCSWTPELLDIQEEEVPCREVGMAPREMHITRM